MCGINCVETECKCNGECGNDSSWTNGSYRVSWEDKDTVLITGPYEQRALIHGGDFEGILSAICAAYNHGTHK